MSNTKLLENISFYKDSILKEYLLLLSEKYKDFVLLTRKYLNHCRKLEKVFNYTPQLIECYERMFKASILFSFECGIEDNLEHFKNPRAKTVLNMEYDYIFEEIRSEDEYSSAYKEAQDLIKIMTPKAFDIYTEILEYFSFLNVYLPKIAHYYGYMNGNKILQTKIPEYVEDTVLNHEYKKMLSAYLDLEL